MRWCGRKHLLLETEYYPSFIRDAHWAPHVATHADHGFWRMCLQERLVALRADSRSVALLDDGLVGLVNRSGLRRSELV